MNYTKDILNKLIDKYEKREVFNNDSSIHRAIQLDIEKIYPAYLDKHDIETSDEINIAIETLCNEKLISAENGKVYRFSKVKLELEKVEDSYKRLKRISIPKQCEKVIDILNQHLDKNYPILNKIIADWLLRIKQYKKIPYDLKYDYERIDNILSIIKAILKLNTETYIRNLSTALFKDSKKLQKEYKNTVENILIDYTDDNIVSKNNILNFYNLYENPTYIFIKGDAIIQFNSSTIKTSEMPDGIALSNATLDNIKNIKINANKVITVENLTTYHDSNEANAVHIYLGGYLNHSKKTLLEKIYKNNKDILYFHKGDIDIYGFLILENLIERTNIPFSSLAMDIETLKRFYNAGLYKELTQTDKKIINDKKNTSLKKYADILQFMLDNNCKVEQEAFKAAEIIDK